MIPKYVFSDIPNTEEGHELVRLMKKYLNKDKYTLRKRGQYLKKGLDWRKYSHGQSIPNSICLRVYINNDNKNL